MDVKKAEFWRTHIAAAKSQQITAADYCRQHSLSYDVFAYWRKRLGQVVIQPKSTFVPVELSQAAPRQISLTQPVLRLSITLPDGTRIDWT